MWNRISTRIPIGKAANPTGWSTTEQDFAIKMLAERAITSSNLSLLDMSKALNTENCGKLLVDLQEISEPDELNIMFILVKDVNLRVKVGQEKSENIKTEVGIAQGDCLSAVIFIFHLATSIKFRERSNKSIKNQQLLWIKPSRSWWHHTGINCDTPNRSY